MQVRDPFSQALRLQRICSEEDYIKRSTDLRQHLVKQGYNGMMVQHQIHRTTSVERTEVLRNSKRNVSDRVPLVVTYHPDLLNLSKILRNSLSILYVSERIKKAVKNAPLVANRQVHNLKDFSLSIDEATTAV